ncbi:ferrochelatase [Desulforhopalus singaporensis]|uniref:Ferrochelatase n=1 Tax=Desulforhopalus singaporensis TaxID=91360 RepID=A0A1H0R7I7_9BACT|nr:ferrochelatase [Desulforhopalus singaporensis]SDP25400.1 ferrochelatase [Desulforhopalus singaporensis]
MTADKKGIVLLNMGGPDRLDDVRPFLYNLFSDRSIIRLGPPFLQKVIAWYIARKRAPKSRKLYEKIGGKSPLREISEAQGAALKKSLRQAGDFEVTVAMRYWPPYASHAIEQLKACGVQNITLLPLYPHFSRATTGSSIDHFLACLEKSKWSVPVSCINSWPTEEAYVEVLAQHILQAAKVIGKKVQVVYSAHSLPVSFIKEGDPYVDHIKATIAAVEKITLMRGKLCFQSRSGPVEWLSPSTPEMITTLGKQGCRSIVMVPISFVSDHIETLYEIDILYRQQAMELGMEFVSTRGLNTSPLFIKALHRLALAGGNELTPAASRLT